MNTESGKDGFWDSQVAVPGIAHTLKGRGKDNQGSFFMQSRWLKYSNKAWNVDTSGGTGLHVDALKIYLDTMAFNDALNMANGQPGTDPFFNILYGTGVDGIPKWPSLQYARYRVEMELIHETLYPQAKAYAEQASQAFTLFVPDAVPYFPSASYNPDGAPAIVEISDKKFLPSGEMRWE